MDQTAELVNQLRIERTDEARRPSVSLVFGIKAAAAVVIVAGLLGVAYAFTKTDRVVVDVASARSIDPTVEPAATSRLDASGYIVARRQATVSSKVTGRVEEVLIEEGQRVAANQVIARLDDANYRASVEQAKAQLAKADAIVKAAELALANAQPIFRRSQQQFQQGLISAQNFETAKTEFDDKQSALSVAQRGADIAAADLAVARQNLDDTVIRAPYDGIVTVRAAQTGEVVSPISGGGGFTRTGIGTIVDMASLELEVDVNEGFMSRVTSNQPVRVKLNAYPEWEIPAKVVAVVPTADRAKATVKVRIGLEVKDSRILPQMGARVSFLDAATADGNAVHPIEASIVIPPEAVGSNESGHFVFVVSGDRVEKRSIQLGVKTADGQVVTSGIGSDARVALGNLGLLSDGAKIEIAHR